MLADSNYLRSTFNLSERKHRYGANVHLLSDPYYESLLAKFCDRSTLQPETMEITKELSKFLSVQAMNSIFPKGLKRIATRMRTAHRQAEFDIELLEPNSKAVVVDLMRAGILPSQICFESLHQVLSASNLRQDHILLNRKVNKAKEVVGVEMSGYKIGGGVDGAFVFIPDPMGATGSTVAAVIDLYCKGLSKLHPSFRGAPKKIIAIHFIVTPEYLSKLKKYSDILEIFALRLDRGLSSLDVLKKLPGEKWNQERGLNDHDYIIPGAGGIGEILNNSFV